MIQKQSTSQLAKKGKKKPESDIYKWNPYYEESEKELDIQDQVTNIILISENHPSNLLNANEIYLKEEFSRRGERR